jgi:hypothetical protein
MPLLIECFGQPIARNAQPAGNKWRKFPTEHQNAHDKTSTGEITPPRRMISGQVGHKAELCNELSSDEMKL